MVLLGGEDEGVDVDVDVDEEEGVIGLEFDWEKCTSDASK